MTRLWVMVLSGLGWSATVCAGDAIELTFAGHIHWDLVEQHVYVEREPGSGVAYRVTPVDVHRYLEAPVYAAAEAVSNAPFDHGEVGPYALGPALGVTLGDWLAAAGTATYTCTDDIGTVTAEFENLVPNGVYTMWYSFIPRPPLEPFVALDIPLGARDGSDTLFVADADGQASYDVVFSPCLQMSGRQTDTSLTIAWHSDGATYGAEPGPFSTATHVHIFANFPIEDR